MIERRLRIAILIYLWGALVEDTSLFLMAWLHPAVWFQLFHGVAPTGLDVGSGFQSLAQLHNNLITGALTVTPVLYGPDGTSLALDPLTLPPLGNVTLDIGNEAATKGWSKYQTGSVVFQYRQNHSGALGAEVYVENRAQSLSFTIPSVESAPRSATQNAVFWLPSPEGEVYVALQNTSDKAVVLTATATLGGRTISLGDVTLVGHASSVIPLSKRSGFAAGAWVTNAVGGITISAAGNGGVVNTGGWIEDDTTGYSTTLTFADPRVGAGSLTATQILVGAVGQLLDLPAPLIISSQLVVRNVTTQPVVVTGTVVFNDNAGSVIEAPLSQVSLQPGEVRRTDLTTVKKEAGIPDSIVSASIRLQYTGGQGALMARVFGASQDNAYGFYWRFSRSPRGPMPRRIGLRKTLGHRF